MSRRLQADLLLLLMCAFWGGTFVLNKAAFADISVLLFLTLRFACAALALIALGGRPVREGWIVGVALFLGCLLQMEGLRATTPSRSAFITSLAVLLVPLIEGVLKRRLPGRGVLAGVALATVGLLLLTNPAGGTSISRGDVYTLGCAFAFAAHILLMGHYTVRVRSLDLATGQICAAGLLSAICLPFVETPMFRSNIVVWSAILITGLICMALAFFLQAWAQRFTTASRTALIFSSEPVFAWIASMAVLHERLGTLATLGALLIVSGIIVSELVV